MSMSAAVLWWGTDVENSDAVGGDVEVVRTLSPGWMDRYGEGREGRAMRKWDEMGA